MSVDLKKQHEAWLKDQVAAGNLPSVEDGVAIAVADMMAIAEGDLAWARPHVDAARQDVAAGNVIDGADVIQRLRTRAAN